MGSPAKAWQNFLWVKTDVPRQKRKGTGGGASSYYMTLWHLLPWWVVRWNFGKQLLHSVVTAVNRVVPSSNNYEQLLFWRSKCCFCRNFFLKSARGSDKVKKINFLWTLFWKFYSQMPLNGLPPCKFFTFFLTPGPCHDPPCLLILTKFLGSSKGKPLIYLSNRSYF